VNAGVSDAHGDEGGDPVARPLGPGDPRQIGKFEIIGLLGAGGMGEVYLGAADGRYAAVKLIRPQLVSPERFKREIAILYRVPRGVAPQVLAHDSTAARPWFAAEYIPGITLDEAVRGSGPLPRAALWLLLARTAAQLREIHEAGIVHRDLKPANVMLVPDSVTLIDFGIAHDGVQPGLTREGVSYGTAGFKAPEQRRGRGPVTAPADVYALGAMLVYAAPGSESSPDPWPLRCVDAALAAEAERCLADDPDARPTAAELVKAALARELAGHLSWPQEVTSRIAAREDFARRPLTKVTTVPPEIGPGPVPGRPPGGGVMRLRSIMLAVGVTAGIASAIVTGVVYGAAAVLESGLEAGLRAALVNGTVNGIGAGLTFGLMHGFAAQFTAGRPVSGPSRPPNASRFTALLLMIAIGLMIGVGFRLMLGPVPGLAAGLMAAVGTGTMTAWGRWLVLARIWPPSSRRMTGKR
jgi:eukaryotic-like serine/threonine-protein kinase